MYYIVKKSVPARDFPSSAVGKNMTMLAPGQVVQADDCGVFENTSLHKTYLPCLMDGKRLWVHDAYLDAASSRQAVALLHGELWLGKKPNAKAIAWYNSTPSGKADPKPKGEAHCTVGALWAASMGADLGSLIARTAAKCEKQARKLGLWHAKGSGYTPKPGDLVLFKASGKSSATHTEILCWKQGDKLYTINFNSSRVCRRMERDVDNGYTYGYIEIKY